MARRKFVCGNWKMHKTSSEAAALVRELRQRLNTQAQVAVAPPFTALAKVKEALVGSPIQLSQILFEELHLPSGRIVHHVFRLEIAMHDADGVSRLHRIGDLRDNGGDLVRR